MKSILIICATCWSITTEVLVFDYMKFNARAELLEQAAHALGNAQRSLPAVRGPIAPRPATQLERL